MNYLETISYLESFINYEKIPAYPYKESLKLERIKNFLTNIGNPQSHLKCLHVAGTKGKGSTCAFLTYILREAGFKTGLYTSPHLSDFRERIRILRPKTIDHRPKTIDFEGMISRNELANLVKRLRPAIEKYNKKSLYGPLSFFEVYTALAFVYFKEKKADFVVLETGLGGRLDATNVVNPLVCAITPISYEHTQKLGNTLEEIAKEKAGIIKSQKSKVSAKRSGTSPKGKSQKLTVISAPQEKEALVVIKNKCKEQGAKLYVVNSPAKFKIKLIGKHQKINAAVAVKAIGALCVYGIKVSVDAIKKGLYNTSWPGRCEVISKKPLVVLDGAQNIASAVTLRQAIKDNFRYNKLILILGISSDKDIQGICQEICPLANIIILTRANNPRASKVDNIEKNIRPKTIGYRPKTIDHRPEIIKTKNVQEAKKIALRLANKEDLILVTGSLFVVGEFRC